MLELYFIRHAECEANTHPEIIGGRSNSSPLTANGKEQARKLYQRLNNINFDEIFCSPAVRAIETARIGIGSLEKIIITDKLQELDQGEWTGKVRKDTYTPETLEIISKDIGIDFSIQLENTSITQIRYTEGTWKLSRFNDYMHLIDNQSLLLYDNKVFI